jgi:uncharacterized protein (DUF952 family)
MRLLIFHILSKAEWQSAVERGAYEPASLQTEGFIHCSTADQVVETANRFFRGRRDLVLLAIDAKRVASPVRFETPANADDARGHELFPHIYGPLNRDAVNQVLDFPCDALETFRLPDALGSL